MPVSSVEETPLFLTDVSLLETPDRETTSDGKYHSDYALCRNMMR